MKEDSDIDICISYDGADASEFRLKVLIDLFYYIYNIKIFQQLPYHIHIRTKLMISRPILSTSPDASRPARPHLLERIPACKSDRNLYPPTAPIIATCPE